MLRDHNKSLVAYMDELMVTNPRLSAAYFKPYFMHDCSCIESPCGMNRTSPYGLPRLGEWKVSTEGPRFEGKLIMNTAAVGMFCVHYITMLEWGGGWDKTVYEVDMYRMGALLHYKIPAVRSGSIYGAMLRKVPPTRHGEGNQHENNDDDDDYGSISATDRDPVRVDNTMEASISANEQRRISPLAVCVSLRNQSKSDTGRVSRRQGSSYYYTVTTRSYDMFIAPILEKLQQAFLLEYI